MQAGRAWQACDSFYIVKLTVVHFAFADPHADWGPCLQLYGAHFKDVDLSRKATKVTFDSDDE